MIPKHYFDVICCPACHGELSEMQGHDDRLRCAACGAEYPVVDGIPVLIIGSDDAVSREVRGFYEHAWKRNQEGALHAKTIHEDITDLGQEYAGLGGRRFRYSMRDKPGDSRYMLDAAAGGQPQELGRTFTYHVCVDFSLVGLAECRRRLGDRAIVACGSLLKLPIKSGVCDGVVAAHCIYHIDKDRQATALAELLRALAPGGRMIVFYANPAPALSGFVRSGWMSWLRALLKPIVRQTPEPVPAVPPPDGATASPLLYTYLHPIEYVMSVLRAGNPKTVEVKALRLFSQTETRPLLRSSIGRPVFALFGLLEKVLESRPRFSYFVTYVVDK